jgi:ubiquinone/menaquinone biosynthesis C-methylase UbiE
MDGKVLFMAVGTGQDIQFFPPGRDITAIDISEKMLERARPRAAAYDGRLELRHLDVHDLDYPDATFDQVFTSCTFCSVPDPVNGLRVLRRVLKPGGTIGMFEHTGSRCFPFSLMLNLMTPLTRRLGPELNRDTPANVRQAGYIDVRVEPVYLDVVKVIHAVAPV